MKIDRFRGKYAFLSNFAPCIVSYDGYKYASVEHAFQAAKTLNPIEREVLALETTPGKAKRAGRLVQLRSDWDEVKVSIMKELLISKFQDNSFGYRDALINTQDAYLEEGNKWGDTFWGTVEGKGQNVLGNLLMEVRELLKKGLI